MRQLVLSLALGVVLVLVLGGAASAQSPNGAAGQMSAWYDCEMFTINFAAVKLDPSHSQVNIIYFQPNSFPVLDQITGGEVPTAPKNGFNPLWLKKVVVLPAGSTLAFCRDDDIKTAFDNGEIGLINTGQVFRCSVVGQK
jgi:hypothetical protein